MDKKTWVEMLVGGIILASLGWAHVLLYDIQGRVSGLEKGEQVGAGAVQGIQKVEESLSSIGTDIAQLKTTLNDTGKRVERVDAAIPNMRVEIAQITTRLNATNGRVDRIADALPEMRIRIAEEIMRGIGATVVSTMPRELSNGNWVSAVHVLDPINKQRFTYPVRLNGPNDKRSKYLVLESVQKTGWKAVPFYELEAWSVEMHRQSEIPAYVDKEASFVWNEPSARDAVQKMKALGIVVSPKVSPLSADITTWEKVAKELEDNADSYKPK